MSAQRSVTDREPIACHNDLGPVNTVFVRDVAIALIDWDIAGPGDEQWELAYAAWRTVPLYGDAFFAARGVPAPDRCRRRRLFADASGLEDRQRTVDLISERIRSLYDTARLWGGEEGLSGWSEVWRALAAANGYAAWTSQRQSLQVDLCTHCVRSNWQVRQELLQAGLKRPRGLVKTYGSARMRLSA